ncbi:MAG: HU family DNA-binding protein [Dysgonamonadaceae bacterium]|jgi:nucleoid DNA-binding protein|nr:HU family DNA-binding protein [Dysgonamonadaceae bacterium]
MNDKINLQTLVSLLAEKAGIPKKEAELFLREYFETVNEALIRDKSVKVKGLGSFKLVEVEDRESVDVTTGNRVLIPAHYKINFVPDNHLAQLVNEPFALFEAVMLDEDSENGEEPAAAAEALEPLEEETEVLEEEIEPLEEEAEPLEEEAEVLEEEAELPEEEVEVLEEETEPEPPVAHLNNVPVRPFARHEREKFRIKWEKIFFGLALLVVAGLAYSIYLIHREDTIFNLAPKDIVVADTVSAQTIEELFKREGDTLRMREKPVEPAAAASVKHRIVRRGERLTLIAQDEYGDKAFWVYLYLENKLLIKDPNRISAGLHITVPLAQKYGINKDDPQSIKKAQALSKEILCCY